MIFYKEEDKELDLPDELEDEELEELFSIFFLSFLVLLTLSFLTFRFSDSLFESSFFLLRFLGFDFDTLKSESLSLFYDFMLSFSLSFRIFLRVSK